MKTRYRLIHRGERGNRFYCVDIETGRRTSLQTRDRDAARQIVFARNQALRQPSINLQLAKAYLAGSDPHVSSRTWQDALSCLIETKQGVSTQSRWRSAARDKAFDPLRRKVIIDTQAELFLEVLRLGTVSTNVHLRKLHNFCLDMGWLPWPILPRKRWPAPQFREKRAITWGEHQRIVQREPNPDTRAFYQMCWHLGGAQSDVAKLRATDVDWESRVISYFRAKTGTISLLRFDSEMEALLRTRSGDPFLFPRLARMDEKHRAKEFRRRCLGLGIQGVSLHSYRYAWAERAKAAGYPERFAQEALGHNSKAVHRAYARKALVELPSLGDYERQRALFNSGGSPTGDRGKPGMSDSSKAR